MWCVVLVWPDRDGTPILTPCRREKLAEALEMAERWNTDPTFKGAYFVLREGRLADFGFRKEG